MKNKKSSVKRVKKTSSVTIRTWVMFGIFLFISFICLKVIANANKITNSIVIPAPVVIPTVVQKPTTIHKVIKK